MATAQSPEVGQVTDSNPILNDAFAEPIRHWEFGEGEPRVKAGRRPAGYIPATGKGGQLEITDDQILLATVNRVRERVRDWREAGYPDVTPVTRALFEHWFSEERERRPFFAQREAIETIVFLTEASAERRQGIVIERHEPYERWAVKLATGAGKTLVMAMTIAWSGLNKRVRRQDPRFADAFFVVAPNLTVKERLRGLDGLVPSEPGSAYEAFDLIPGQFAALLGELRVQVSNWHAMSLQEDSARSVVKLGPESDAAFARRVLGGLGDKRRFIVLNDEAHHAWRPPPGARATGEDKDELLAATVWIDGLERLHRSREVLRAVDFSATPMYPAAVGREKAFRPFEWVVSDFGLVDAIEAGLVKVPRIPTDDDAGRSVPKYRNLWQHVREAAPKRGDDPEDESLPMHDYLAEIDGPLRQLADEWHETFERWTQAGREVPPVMIIVCADTKMAHVLERYVADRGDASQWLRNRDGEAYTVRIDSKLLADAEAREEGESASDAAERLREVVATVGREGEPGEQVRCLISVGMLSEGWDARNVTQILGLRAFQSQLLCEQVVGRGLRRTDYSDLSQPEFVDVYGVPFQLLPFARASGANPIKPPRATRVRSLRAREGLRLSFPRVEQIVQDVDESVEVDLDAIEPVRVSAELDPTATFVEFDIGSARGGLSGETQDRSRSYERFREQQLVFRLAGAIARTLEKPQLFPQLAQITERVLSERVELEGGVARAELANLRYVLELQNRITSSLRSHSSGRLLPVLNDLDPIGTTECDFQTTRECVETTKSHVSHVVADSNLEFGLAMQLEQDRRVASYVKNERLFFEIPYRHLGRTRRYKPDFLVKLAAGGTLIVEGKGNRRDEKDAAKATATRRWLAAVNAWGELGAWDYSVCRSVEDLKKALDQAGDGEGTWNSPEAIERHRAMTPEQRFRATADLSRAALRFRDAERVDAG